LRMLCFLRLIFIFILIFSLIFGPRFLGPFRFSVVD
jgi:hypothetical protein